MSDHNFTAQRDDGLLLRKTILKRLKTQVQLYLGKEPADLRRYALAYKKNIERQRWSPSSKKELYQKIAQTDFVFGGDFHAFAQAQKVHLRALRELSGTKKVLLGLECVESKHQKVVDQFVAGKLSEREFKKKIKWDKNWGFPWEQYRPLFDIVKKNHWRILALNYIPSKKSGRTLEERDRHAADLLRKAYAKKSKEEMIYVIYGDLHVAKEHLPHKVTAKLKGPPTSLILYLNPEKIYFDLVKKNLEHKVDVIRFSSSEFCVIESPPWVKWQSYLLFLEENIDELLPDDESQLDYTEHVNALIKLIKSDLKIRINFEGSVYSVGDEGFLDRLQEKASKADYVFIKKMIDADLNFYFPEEDTAFLCRGTVNHAASLAAQIIHAKMSGRRKLQFQLPEHFPALIWVEAMAFFVSKIVNPHRKSINLDDLKKQLAAFSPEDQGEEALKLALDQKMKDLIWMYSPESQMVSHYPARETISYYKAAKILGGMMGEGLYQSFRSGRLSRSQVVEWMKHPLDANFYDFYVQVLKEIDKMSLGPA